MSSVEGMERARGEKERESAGGRVGDKERVREAKWKSVEGGEGRHRTKIAGNIKQQGGVNTSFSWGVSNHAGEAGGEGVCVGGRCYARDRGMGGFICQRETRIKCRRGGEGS